MDRSIIYAGQIPLTADLLHTNRFAMIGLAKLAAAVLGTGTIANGLAATPTSPASMQVSVAPGEIYAMANVDATAFGSLAANTTHSILKQGIVMDATLLTFTAPATAGQSIAYLIQGAYQDTDAQPVVLPYYNASNPAQAFSGPNNSGSSQNTVRRGAVVLQIKAGTAAATGSEVAPAPDAGYIPLWVVRVANGQTTITATNIAQATGAPFLSGTVGRGVRIFDANGTFVVPPNVTTIWASAVAGGGGGGGGAGTSGQSSFVGGGGGGGGGAGQSAVFAPLAVTPGQSLAITVGGGGSGGITATSNANGSAGTAGGNTSIGSLLTLAGGSGGALGGWVTANALPSGGAGAAGGAGYPAGSFGIDGNYAGNGGPGASSPLGGGGGGGRAATQTGFAGGAAGPGGGGGGGGGSYGSAAFAGGNGGNGGAGRVIIHW